LCRVAGQGPMGGEGGLHGVPRQASALRQVRWKRARRRRFIGGLPLVHGGAEGEACTC
jgi:hypothetical protein